MAFRAGCPVTLSCVTCPALWDTHPVHPGDMPPTRSCHMRCFLLHSLSSLNRLKLTADLMSNTMLHLSRTCVCARTNSKLSVPTHTHTHTHTRAPSLSLSPSLSQIHTHTHTRTGECTSSHPSDPLTRTKTQWRRCIQRCDTFSH